MLYSIGKINIRKCMVVKNDVEKLVMIEKMATKIRAEDNAIL